MSELLKGNSLQHKYKKIQEEKAEIRKGEAKNKRRSSLILIVSILLMLSVANMFSVSLGLRVDQLIIVKKHVFMIGVGLLLMFTTSKLSYHFYQKTWIKLSIFLFPLLIFLFMFMAPDSLVPIRNGAKAWIQFGSIAIQPAELFKVSYIIILSSVLAKVEEKTELKDYPLIIFIILAIFTPYAFFILAQNDLGAIIHYALITGYLLALSNISIKIIRLWTLITSLSVIGTFGYIYSRNPESLTGYKLHRIYSFLDGLFTGNYSPEFGYQVKQALIGFGSGGFLGKGFANGIQKYSYVPETATDFITVTFGEEFGFVGMMILVSFYLLLYWILITISKEAPDAFGKYLAAGIGAYLITQVFINIGVAIGILPVFGLTLPLFSNGGSSIMAILTALGIGLNINDTSHNI